MDQPPLSPPSEPTKPIPLDSPIRTSALHDLLPEIRVPGAPLPTHKYHPVTCETIDVDADEIRSQLEQLRREYPTREAALKAQQQAAKEAREKIDQTERKREEIKEAVDNKVKERDLELKVLSKYREVKASEIPS